ncbi:hypothetical protein RMCBS344292_14692 [Rhizopus microsporus]|nr:hypothetical protein RMCBS344292_14692 [Rhizopus microsporus]
MVQNHLIDSLSERLAKDVHIFDNLLKLIPAKFYVMDKNDHIDSKFQHNKRKKAPKQAIKEATKKAKKAKLDPDNVKTVMDVQSEKAKQLKEEEEAKKKEEEEEEEMSMEVDSSGFSGLDDSESIATESTSTSTQEPAQLKPMEKSDIEQLRHRLHERINQLRQKRNAPGANSAKPKSRDEILSARNKKKEDRKKAIKAQKEKGNNVPTEELVQVDKKTNNTTPNGNQRSADSIKTDADVFFGKLNVGKEQKKKKGPTDAKTQLKLVEAKKEKLEKLKQEDKSKAEEMMEKEEWNKVLALATGEKVKDDPKLLKKTVKRQEKQKQKSAQEWKKRLEKQKKDQMHAIKKREENIKAKIEEKKNKKKGIKPKGNKKKARPGFEGGKRSKGGKVTKPNPPKLKK